MPQIPARQTTRASRSRAADELWRFTVDRRLLCHPEQGAAASVGGASVHPTSACARQRKLEEEEQRHAREWRREGLPFPSAEAMIEQEVSL